MKFIFDEHLSPRLARSFQVLLKGDHEIVALRDKFGPSVTDLQWISALNGDGRWIVISGDRRITRNRAEYNAFRHSKLIGFFMSQAVYRCSVTRQAARLLVL